MTTTRRSCGRGTIVLVALMAVIAGCSQSPPVATPTAGAARPTVTAEATAARAAQATSTPVPATPRPTAPQPTSTPALKTPTTIAELPSYLETFLPPEARGKVDIMEGDRISAFFTFDEDFMPDVDARKYARDFVFAAYATGLPVKTVQVVLLQKANQQVGLSITLGANVAATQPISTWTERGIGPTIFINWMKERARVASNKSGADRAYIDGPWAK